MLKVIARRLLFAIPLLWVVATISFFLVSFIPGDPAQTILGESATAADIAKLRHQLGLDQPLLVQYVVWLGQIVRGDFGTSIILNVSTWDAIAPCIPITTTIAVLATLFAFLIGITLGTLAVVRGGLIDRLVRVWAGISNAIPNFWLGPILAWVFSIGLGWFPVSGRGTLGHLVLPAVTLGASLAAVLARITRASVIEELREVYVLAARARGLSRLRTVVHHAFRNSLIPIVTVLGLQVGSVLTGAVITETIFAWPGVGRLLIQSITFRDYPLVQGCILLIALTYVAVNLLVDLVYGLLDPRIRYE